MLVAQSPISGHQRLKSGRKPLQPKSPSLTPLNPTNNTNAKPNAIGWTEISHSDNANKENIAPIFSTPVKKEPFPVDSIDASLAEELSAIREKLERIRKDKEKTDKMLSERARMLDLQMKEVLYRGQLQRQLEIEVDRLYRLKEIKLSCASVSPLRSLRDKEMEKKIKQDQVKASNPTEKGDELKEESGKESSDSSEVK